MLIKLDNDVINTDHIVRCRFTSAERIDGKNEMFLDLWLTNELVDTMVVKGQDAVRLWTAIAENSYHA